MFYGPEYIQNLRARARIGDAQAQKVFTDAGFALGVSLARTISLLDPSRIVLTGKAMQAYDLFKHGMNKGLESSLLAPLLDAVNLEVLPWDEDFILQGLLIKALKHLDEALIH